MIDAVAIAETFQPGTGTSPHDWFDAVLRDYQSQTGHSLPVRFVYVGHRFGPIVFQKNDLYRELETITDPNASKRVVRQQITGMAENLSQLSFVAKRLIPGLRELTSKEQGSLRHYYKRVY